MMYGGVFFVIGVAIAALLAIMPYATLILNF